MSPAPPPAAPGRGDGRPEGPPAPTAPSSPAPTAPSSTPHGIGVAPRRRPLGESRPAVLVLRALGLGDLLTAVPALRALRRGLPDFEIVLAAPRELAPVVRLVDCVDRLLPVAGREREVPPALPRAAARPALAVNLHGRGPASHRLLARSAPGTLWAFHHPSVPEVPGPAWVPYEHERLRWCRLLRWYGLAADPEDLRIAPPDAPGPVEGHAGPVVLHPGARAPARRWPVERFAAVAREVRRAGRPVVVTAGPGEAPLARAVAERAGLAPSALAGGPQGLPVDELCGLVAGAHCVVVGDTGLAHLATALGTRSVVLYGPVSPALWGPPAADGRHTALWHPGPDGDPESGQPGDPHADHPDARLLRITVDEVLAEVLAEPTAPRAAAEPSLVPGRSPVCTSPGLGTSPTPAPGLPPAPPPSEAAAADRHEGAGP
ncbi:glycosyltransferase family 9 protein [Streptomyces sp. NPDC053431]|uniref:glycosyltransferase family 9 protein n=1 Tax=Streptomyces sp. NPDC053431 TaxID=3365703 RepID=UPI0037D92B99